MKALLCWDTAILAIVAAVPGDAQSAGGRSADKGTVRDKPIGSWRLAWLQPTADGGTKTTECAGILVYTQDIPMSVQTTVPDMKSPSGSGPVQYEQCGYEAYFGTYEVNEHTQTVTHPVEGALVRALIGKSLSRVYWFSDRQLVLTSSRPAEHWTIAWEHY
jgi:hypothetical protein